LYISWAIVLTRFKYNDDSPFSFNIVEKSFETTFDAVDLVIDAGDEDFPSASWPSVISGPDWVNQDSIDISPFH